MIDAVKFKKLKIKGTISSLFLTLRTKLNSLFIFLLLLLFPYFQQGYLNVNVLKLNIAFVSFYFINKYIFMQ